MFIFRSMSTTKTQEHKFSARYLANVFVNVKYWKIPSNLVWLFSTQKGHIAQWCWHIIGEGDFKSVHNRSEITLNLTDKMATSQIKLDYAHPGDYYVGGYLIYVKYCSTQSCPPPPPPCGRFFSPHEKLIESSLTTMGGERGGNLQESNHYST